MTDKLSTPSAPTLPSYDRVIAALGDLVTAARPYITIGKDGYAHLLDAESVLLDHDEARMAAGFGAALAMTESAVSEIPPTNRRNQ